MKLKKFLLRYYPPGNLLGASCSLQYCWVLRNWGGWEWGGGGGGMGVSLLVAYTVLIFMCYSLFKTERFCSRLSKRVLNTH